MEHLLAASAEETNKRKEDTSIVWILLVYLFVEESDGRIAIGFNIYDRESRARE